MTKNPSVVPVHSGRSRAVCIGATAAVFLGSYCLFAPLVASASPWPSERLPRSLRDEATLPVAATPVTPPVALPEAPQPQSKVAQTLQLPPELQNLQPAPPPKPAAPRPRPVQKLPHIFGWLERVSIPAVKDEARAKLDVGAKTSSMNADIIKTFKRDGVEFVLFRTDLDSEHKMTLEREIIRWSKIKGKNGDLIERPVIKMEFCLGTRLLSGETNLAERDHFNYPVLIGRNMLSASDLLINAGRKFTTKPKCKVEQEADEE